MRWNVGRFKELGFWVGLSILGWGFFVASATASDPRRDAPVAAPWMEIRGAWAEGQQDYIYNPVMVYAQCDGSTRVFVAVTARGRYSDAGVGSGVSITAVPGGCERTKAEEPR